MEGRSDGGKVVVGRARRATGEYRRATGGYVGSVIDLQQGVSLLFFLARSSTLILSSSSLSLSLSVARFASSVFVVVASAGATRRGNSRLERRSAEPPRRVVPERPRERQPSFNDCQPRTETLRDPEYFPSLPACLHMSRSRHRRVTVASLSRHFSSLLQRAALPSPLHYCHHCCYYYYFIIIIIIIIITTIIVITIVICTIPRACSLSPSLSLSLPLLYYTG